MSPTTSAQLALVLFLLVFLAVAIRHGGTRRAVEHAEAAQLPLADDDGGAS